MAMLWQDNFENYGTTVGGVISPPTAISSVYTTTNGTDSLLIANGHESPYAIRFPAAATYTTYFITGDLTVDATTVLGCALKFSSLLEYGFLILLDGTVGVVLHLEPTGKLSFYRGSTLLGTSAAACVSVGPWYYVEVKVTCGGGVSGSYEVRVNGVNVLSASGVNTKEGVHDYYTKLKVQGMGAIYDIDCLYFLDSIGASYNDFLGDPHTTITTPLMAMAI